MKKNVSIIVAIDQNNGIGVNNNLLTHISADLKRFKQITSGKPVIMGRNTWLSLPIKPLPNRTNIVVTTNHLANFNGALIANSIEQAINMCANADECFVVGGASVYKQCLPFANKLYITKINTTFNADTFFPTINWPDWAVISETTVTNDEQAGVGYSFIDLCRK